MPTVFVVMGVSGSGKTTIANGIGQRLGIDVLEGDTFHPPANIEKMKHKIPLTDEDRWPWLRAIAAAIDKELAEGRSAIVACSALKRSYRDILIGPRKNVVLIYLKGSRALIGERVRRRTGHFMPPELLDSQFATLEEPEADENPVIVPVDGTPDEIVDEAIAKLRERKLIP